MSSRGPYKREGDGQKQTGDQELNSYNTEEIMAGEMGLWA